MPIWEQEAECDRCEGTGIVKGRLCDDEVGFVCRKCDGTGKRTIELEWKPFNRKKRRDGIERVYQEQCGIYVGRDEVQDYELEDFGGVSYEDWWDCPEFPRGSGMREFVCPR